MLVCKDPLHDVVLVFLLDETSFDAQSLISVVFTNSVGDLFHPNALLTLFQVTSNFQIAVNRGELADVPLLAPAIGCHSQG